jgi:hypothetical protein
VTVRSALAKTSQPKVPPATPLPSP